MSTPEELTAALASGATALVVGLITLLALLPRLRQAGIVGKDMNKPGRPEVPEMGGLALLAGVVLGLFVALGLQRFAGMGGQLDVVALSAGLICVLLTALIGIVDDIMGVHQPVKAFMPVIAALPLVAASLGETAVALPVLGKLELGWLYAFVVVPIGVTCAANAVNILAGFNGLEAGLGIVGTSALLVIAGLEASLTAIVVLSALLGALVALLYFNWYPAKIFIGDVGTLSIGALWAAACIIGNLEVAGAILIVPYALDFALKARKKFPSTGWWGEYRDGKLYCPTHSPVGLAQLVLKLFGGLHERQLVLMLIGIEAVFGLLAIWFYL